MSEQPEEQVILKVVLTKDRRIGVTIFSKHIASLCHVHKLIGVEIDKMIIDEQIRTKKEQMESRIITPEKHGIVSFVRNLGRKHAG